MRLYNTLTRRKEPFEPLNPPRVGFYMCGMTVQDRPHLGHLRTFLAGDVLRRYLEFKGYQVVYVQNFTDIDDKIIQRSHREGEDWRAIAQRYIDEYLETARQMNLKPATYYPRATLHIQEIIETVQKLLRQGVAYKAGGSVYFDLTKFPAYGRLSGKRLEDLLAGYRVEPAPGKRNPADFALWKGWKPGEPYWYAPFGKGRPGWHIECSVMSTHYLGQPFDIHGGGMDLIFPHHENEIAQAVAAHGKDFARYWFHVGFVRARGEKMSKSTGIFTPVLEALKQVSANALRHYLLSTHYRNPIDFDFAHVHDSERALERLFAGLEEVESEGTVQDLQQVPVAQELLQRFEERMDDDLDTPGALAVLFEGLSVLRKTSGVEQRAVKTALEVILNTLGFRPPERTPAAEVLNPVMDILLEVRRRLRQEKRFDLADYIRDSLMAAGIVLEDTREGTRWKFKR